VNALDRLREYAIFTVGAPIVALVYVGCLVAMVFMEIEWERGESD
jgi:hypothetical protein